MKRFVIISLLLIGAVVWSVPLGAQPTAVIKVLGVSDRDVARSPDDIFTRASTGLPNVGVGEIVYLEGHSANPEDTVTAWEWSLTARPNNSQAQLSSADQPIVTLVPDVVGTFRVQLRITTAAGQSQPVVIPINSANYVGVGGIAGEARIPQCAACHAGQVDNKVNDWMTTKHAVMFAEGIEGRKEAHYQLRCIRCHTVGYDTLAIANNGGFDDRAREEGWHFPDSLRDDNWENMVQNYPQTASMANIQCENCHGPGSAHSGRTNDNRIAVSYENGVCAKCHDSGSHHFRPYQWDFSKHSHPTRTPTGPGRNSCVRCHTGFGFIEHIRGVPDSLKTTDYFPITCVACHKAHTRNDQNHPHQLRTVANVRLMNGVEVNFGYGNLCANCHQSRRNAVQYVQRYSPHFGPHYSNQADMLRGTNAIEYGQEIRSTPHYMVIENACVGCHMAESPEDPNHPAYLKVGDHTFAMRSPEGVEHVETCAECHGEIESFEDIMAEEDHDGDGEVESAVAEVEGLMERLALLLPPVGENRVEVTDAYTPEQLRAAYNYLFVHEDGSRGLHNFEYAVGILKAALADSSNLGVERLAEPLPNQFSLDEPFPNPFNAYTTISYALPHPGEVSAKVYDLAGREVMTVLQGRQPAGAYKALVKLNGQPSGVYILKMEAGPYSASRKLILAK